MDCFSRLCGCTRLVARRSHSQMTASEPSLRLSRPRGRGCSNGSNERPATLNGVWGAFVLLPNRDASVITEQVLGFHEFPSARYLMAVPTSCRLSDGGGVNRG